MSLQLQPAFAQDMEAVEDPSVSIIAFTSNGALAGTVVDGFEFTNFELPQITDSGNVVFGGNQQFYVASPGGTISTITDFDGRPFFNSTIGLSDLNVDEPSGDVFFTDSVLQSYVLGDVRTPGEFEEDFSLGPQNLGRDVRTLNGVTAIIDSGFVAVRRNELLDFEEVVFGVISETNGIAIANDVRFAGQDTLIGSFVFGADGSRNEHAIGVYDLNTDTFAVSGPDFNVASDQLFNGLTIPAGQFTQSSSLDPGSSNGDVLAFVVPVVENISGNFARALATQTVDRDPDTGAIIGISASQNIVFASITSTEAGVPLEITNTTIGGLIFLTNGPDLDPVVSENGDVIFFASARAPDATDTISGFWRLRENDGVVEPVLIDGTSIDGVTSFGTVGQATLNFDEGGSFVNFNPQLTINADGQIAATVRIDIPGEDDPVVAIIGQNVQNEFFIVAHEGQQVDLGDEGGTRTIAVSPSPAFIQNVNLVTGTLNQGEQINSNELDGVGDGFNVNSQLAFLINFDDGTEAIVRADLGTLVGPDITVFRWTGGCGSVEWGTACTIGGDEGSNWVNRDNPDQVAPEAPGENPGIQRAIIEGADVFISAAPVSITSIETTGSTLNVSESLTVAEASNVDRLEVGGTVTSGNAPFTVRRLVLNGGTLEGAGGFTLTGEATDSESLVTINTAGAGNANTINTMVSVNGGGVRITEDANVVLGSNGLIQINDGAPGTFGDLRIAGGVSITGSGSIDLNGNADFDATFSGDGNQTSTVDVDIALERGELSVSNGTLAINGDLTIGAAIRTDGAVRIFDGGRAIFTGDVSVGDGTFFLDRFVVSSSDNDSLARIVFDGTTLDSQGTDGVVEFDGQDFTARPNPVRTRAEAEALVPVISMSGTNTNGPRVDFRLPAGLLNTTFANGITVNRTTLLLSGNTQFMSEPTEENFDPAIFFFGGATAFQSSGTTRFGGDGRVRLPLDSLIDVAAGDVIFDASMLQFGENIASFSTLDLPATIRLSEGATATFGADPEGTATVIQLGAAQSLSPDEDQAAGSLSLVGDENGSSGLAVFESVRFEALSENDPPNAPAPVTFALDGTNLDTQGVILRNAEFATDVTISNEGNLTLDTLSGDGVVTIENLDRLFIESNLSIDTRLTNVEVGRTFITRDVSEISSGFIQNDGDLLIESETSIAINANLRESETGRFNIGRDAFVSAPTQEFASIVTTRFEDGGQELDILELKGRWELQRDATVTLGEGAGAQRSLRVITADASLTLESGARLLDVDDEGGSLETILGQFESSSNVDLAGSLTVGGAGAPNASLIATGIAIDGNLDHLSGTVRARGQDRAIAVMGDVTSNGALFADRFSAQSFTQGETGVATIDDRFEVTGSVEVSGALTVAEISSSGQRISTGDFRVSSTGTFTSTQNILVRDFENQGTVTTGSITARSIDTGSASTTTFAFLDPLEGDANIGGNFTPADLGFATLRAQNITLKNNANVERISGFDAQDRLVIGTGIDLIFDPDLEADNFDLASLLFTRGIEGASTNTPSLNRFDIRAGGVLSGVGTEADNGGLEIFGFEIVGPDTSPAIIGYRDTFIAAGGVTQGDLTFLGNVTNAGAWLPGFSPGVAAVGGNYTQEATGVLELEIGGNTPDLYDIFLVAGTATFDPASTINITLIDPDPDDGVDEVFRPRTGDTFDILLADNVEVTGGGDIADIITVTNGDQAGSFMPTLMTIDGQLMLQLEAMFGSRLLETAGLTAGQGGIAGALDSISEVGDNDALTDFAVALDGLGDGQTGASLDQAGFSFASSLYDISFAAVNAASGHINRHIDARIWTPAGTPGTVAIAPAPSRPAFPNNAGFAGGGVFEEASQAAEMVASIAANQSFAGVNGEQSRFGLIASGGYSFGSADASLNQTGLDYSGGGGALGAEVALNEAVVVGASASITSLSGDTDNTLGDIDATHYGIAAHAVAEAGPVVLDAQLGFGWLDVDSDRRIAVGDVNAVGEGETDGSTFHARARVSLPLKGGNNGANFIFGPSVEVSASKVDLDGFSETGAGDVGLTLGGDTQWRSNVAIGVNAAASFELGKMVLTPRASAAYEIALERGSDALTTAFVGAPGTQFATPTDRIGKDRVKVMTAADLRLSRRISASIAYQGSFGGDIKEHTMLAQARMSF